MEDIRVGVFICHCGTNIGGVLDIESITEYAKTIPNVVYATNNIYTCSELGLSQIRKSIQKHNLNRVVIASCTPRTHEPLFRKTCQEAGLNPYLFEMVNIREQDSWVHMKEPERGTEKAKDLIRMGVNKAILLEPLEKIKVGVNPSALIIGAGIAGMNAALNLANQGFQTTLIEKEKELGGNLKSLNKVFPIQEDASNLLEITQLVKSHPNIKVFTSAIPIEVEGFIGNFVISVKKDDQISKIKAGIIIVATGAKVLTPEGLFGYNGKNIITQLELEQLLKNNKVDGQNIVMIQCVGARNEERPYCSNICCMTALKNSMLIKEINPNSNIVILYRDIQTHGTIYEDYYRKAREKGIVFINYSLENPPTLKDNQINVYNVLRNEEINIPYDLVVLSTPLIAQDDSTSISKMLKIPQQDNNFFLEAHVKLRPSDFATDGIFICGSSHWPSDIRDSISQAYAAASRASRILSRDTLEIEGAVAEIDQEKCISCNVCIKLCPYNAISENEEDKIVVNQVLCKGCGVCSATCPENAITIHHFTSDQILSQLAPVEESQEPEYEPKILGFLCNWCSYSGADLAGVSRIQYPPNLRVIRVMCSGRVDPLFIAEAFLNGFDGILVLGCHLGDCHYITGNYEAEIKINGLKKLLKLSGFSERLRLDWISASEGVQFAKLVNEFTDHIRKLGPSPIKNKEIKEEVIENLHSIKSVLSDSRIRTLFGRERLIISDGNVYNEVIPEDQFEKILTDAIENEFIRQKIIEIIKDEGMSVPEISKKIKLEPHVILTHIVTLRARGLVDLKEISEDIPKFISIKE
ncbi:MAG: hydrogenase iron-sulfur subunit [Promethearchaeota archaeon]|nr:MAG: hydrogenase iron-sulfur subunit [Candidatus Lokiarchaeota archaeon]